MCDHSPIPFVTVVPAAFHAHGTSITIVRLLFAASGMDKVPHLEPSTGWERRPAQPAEPHPTAQRPEAAPFPPHCGTDSNPIWDGDSTFPSRVWLNTLHKRVSQHVQAPRCAKTGVAGNQHPSFSIDLSPFDLVERKSLEAGLTRQRDTRANGNLVRTWKGTGPYTAYKFCRTNLRKPYGQGSGVLAAPRRNQPYSGLLTMAIPPIEVRHTEGEDELTMHVDFYLSVFLDTNTLILPSKANQLYKQISDPDELFKRMAIHILGEMAQREFPLSSKFHALLGSEFDSGESELSDEEGEEAVPRLQPLLLTGPAANAARDQRKEKRKRDLASA